MLLHEDAALERLPSVRTAKLRELAVRQPAVVVCPLDHVAMRIARVAVAAPELAPDVRIDGPEVHARLLRRIEDRLGCERHELRAAETLVENWEGGPTVGRSGGLEKRELRLLPE